MLSVFLLILSLFIPSTEQIRLRIEPVVCRAPCQISVELIIPHQSALRWAAVEIDGPISYVSRIPLDVGSGERFVLAYANLTSGKYLVKGVIYDDRREVGRSMRQLLVTAPQSGLLVR